MGKELYSMDSFPATSHSLSYIWFAPDHVRAWRASVYKELGGHNKELSVCDDHELMIRTYLNSKMFHIPRVLYVYRITGKNSWLERNASIQTKTVELFKQHAWDLAIKDAKDKNLYIVNLGNPKEGCINLGEDLSEIEYGIPLPDNSVGVLNASHILQKMPNHLDSMKEIHRVLADGGWAFIEVPSTDGRGAWQDPSHKSFWNENSFWYYSKDSHINLIKDNDIKFQNFGTETIWWDNNIAVTKAILFAEKEQKHRPKLT
jgi:SAM-dependent methyltransferase